MWLRNDCALTECYKNMINCCMNNLYIYKWIFCLVISVTIFVWVHIWMSLCATAVTTFVFNWSRVTYLYTFHCCAIYSSNIKCYACLMFLLILFLNKHVKLYWFLLYQSIPVFCCWSSTKFFPTTEIKNSCHWFNMKEISKVNKR